MVFLLADVQRHGDTELKCWQSIRVLLERFILPQSTFGLELIVGPVDA